MIVFVRRLISQPLDLEDRRNEEGGKHDELCKDWECPFLHSGVHPDHERWDILLILLILILIGVVPAWPHSRGWDYGPAVSLESSS